MPHIVILGTLDTKLSELLYLRKKLQDVKVQEASHVKLTLIDCGRDSSVFHKAITITQSELVSRFGPKNGAQDLQSLPRGDVIKFMIQCATACVKELNRRDEVHGVISAGGSGGTSLASAVMRDAIPIGVPKLIVSTIACGDMASIVGESDVTMMYSVVDIAGSNVLLRNVLGNAAGAMGGMAAAYEKFSMAQTKYRQKKGSDRRKRIGVTMFGVTTPCVDKIREHLEDNYDVEVLVFHATGSGGRAMERLVEDGRLDAVLDVTTTEICDLLAGGNMSAGPTRLEAALKAGIPNILSLGATDMVNFGPKSTVPERYHDRKLFEHNPSVTLMRTNREECQKAGEFIVDKIKKHAKKPENVQIWIPEGGVSVIATPDGAFADQGADQALAETVKNGLRNSGVRIVADKRDINNGGFATEIAESLMRLLENAGKS
ncbi:hypothetical protein MBLNU459_g6321t1 [Dothideomycetes sp. NU459]